MPAARMSAGVVPFSQVTPLFMAAAPEDFGFQDNLLIFDAAEIYRLAYRVTSFSLAWSVAGEVEDEDAGTRTVYAGSGTAISRRYFVRAIGEGLDFFTRVQGFFADFGEDANNTYADSVRKTLSASEFGSSFTNLSLLFNDEGGVSVSIYDLDSNALVEDFSQDAGYTLAGASGSLPEATGAFFAKFWPEVVFSLVPDGYQIAAQSGGALTTRRTGQFLGQAFDFYTQPEITVSLSVAAGPEMPF